MTSQARKLSNRICIAAVALVAAAVMNAQTTSGTIVGTVVQQPYEWGYQGMKDMAKYLEGDKSFIPTDKLIIVPTKIIDKSSVDAFWAELKERQGRK